MGKIVMKKKYVECPLCHGRGYIKRRYFEDASLEGLFPELKLLPPRRTICRLCEGKGKVPLIKVEETDKYYIIKRLKGYGYRIVKRIKKEEYENLEQITREILD